MKTLLELQMESERQLHKQAVPREPLRAQAPNHRVVSTRPREPLFGLGGGIPELMFLELNEDLFPFIIRRMAPLPSLHLLPSNLPQMSLPA